MMELMDYLPLTLCDEQNRQTIRVTGYTSFEYIERWGQRDSFTLVLPRESKHAAEIFVGRIMLIPADDTHSDMRCVVIKQIKVDENKITATGNDYLWELMECRLVLVGTQLGSGTDTQTGVAETVARHYLNVNCLEAEDESRRDPFCVVEGVRSTPLGETVTIEGRLQSIASVMESICTQGGINIYGAVIEDGTDRGWHIEVRFSTGVDRSQTSEVPDNNWVVLSESYGNARVQSYVNTAPKGTVATVAGKGSGASRLQTTVGDTDLYGISRRELFVNASDCDTNESMTARGNEALEDAKSITIKMSLTNTRAYGRDFTLGDIVTADMGIYGSYNVRVTECDTKISETSVTMDVTLGATLKTVVRVIRDSVEAIPLRRQ